MLQLEREVNGEPIIFVAHSLGGILVKEGLHWSKSNLTPRYQELHRCTKHIVFLVVPHRGSPIANMGEILTRLANAAFQDTNRHIVSSLEVDGEILGTIHSEFMKMMHTEDFSVHSFQEGRGVSSLMGFSGKVVNDFSSKLDHPLEVVETIDANHMQMARFGDVEDPGYHKVSSVIAGYVLRLVKERRVKIPATTMATAIPIFQKEERHFRVPHISNRYFVGREKELGWLQRQLKDPSMHKDQRRVVIWGCGGAGKTQLASTYAFRNQTDFSAVFWVTASSEVTLKKTYADIARHLGMATSSNGTTDGNVQQTSIDFVKDWFTDHQQGDWLLVIDNADNLEEVDIVAFIPPTNKGNVIITSRNRQAEGFGQAIELGEMDSVDATSLLLRRAAVHQPTPTDQALAFDIAKSLGYLALAIEHAGAYVQSSGGSLLEYKEQFKINRRTMMEKIAAVSMHKDSVFETFTISFEKIKKHNFPAARLLTFLGFLDSEATLENLILSNHEDINVFKIISEPPEFHAAVQELLSFSLIRVKLNGDVKSISLHPLVHYFSRARLTIENHWCWTEIAVDWVLQSSIATKAYESYYPHLQEQLKQITSLKKLPKDPERRRRVWCSLGLLLEQHLCVWRNQGAMDELDKYAKMVMTVMEEDPNDRELLTVLSTISVMSVQVQTVQFMDCSDTFDEVLRRYILKQMTPSAATALRNAHNTATGNISTARTAAMGKIQSKDDIPLNIADIAISVDHDIMTGLISVRELAGEANNIIEQTDSTARKENVGTNLTNPKPRIGDTNINPAVSSTPSMTESVTDSASTSPMQPGPALSDLEASVLLLSNEGRTIYESPSQILPSTVSSPSSQPQYLSDGFLYTDHPIYIDYLKGYLLGLARIYTYYNRTAEADLLLEYSALALDSSQIPNQPLETSRMVLKAGRFAAQNDLEGLLNTFPKILDADPLENLPKSSEIQHCAIDYAILLNKVGRYGEAERVINTQFCGSEQSEEARARELKDKYLWVRKTLARALGLQGRVEEEYAVLRETLKVAEGVFGRNSLPAWHATFLLRVWCEEHSKWRESGEVERYTKELDFGNLYGAGSGKVRYEGFQMGMLLWAQGVLEETVFVFECFLRRAEAVLGENDPLTRKARRADALAREDWATETRAVSGADLVRFGTMLFARKLDDLALLVENEIA